MPGDVRFVAPVDELMTSFGLAYMQNRARYFAADDLFPYVPFDGYNGSIYVDEALNTLGAVDARGGDEIGYPTVSMRGKAIPFMAEDWGFQSLITKKQALAMQGPGTPLTFRRARALTEKVWLAREVRAEAIVDAITPDASLGGANKWNSTAPAPRTNVMTGKAQTLKYTGREANKIVFTGSVADDLITRETTGSAGAIVKDSIKYVMQATGRAINEPLIAAFFDVDRVRFAKGVQAATTTGMSPTVGGALSPIGTYIFDADEAYIVYNEDDPGPETSNYGVSPGPLYYGATSFDDPMRRGTWVQAFQALIEFAAEVRSIYVLGTVL